MADFASDAQVPRDSMTASEVGRRFSTEADRFDEMARAAFEHQKRVSPIYRRFTGDREWTSWDSIPFLPVEAFKWDGIVDRSSVTPEIVFASSGTGGRKSRHPVLDLAVYERSAVTHFAEVFGEGPFLILAHLPTYQRSPEPSSLLYMIDVLIRRFGGAGSGFVMDRSQLGEKVRRADEGLPTLIFGTAFGLLDVIDVESMTLPPSATVVETGGMKTYRREITRSALHERLSEGFGLRRESIRSEYGMCELLSQCYTRGGEIFFPPAWMRFKVVDVEDPDSEVGTGYPGLLALFDLANVHAVSAVLTSDLAIRRSDGFELLGRADAAEIRGCNFLIRTNP